MENTYCIYKHTAPNGKCYIGLTKHGANPNTRWQGGYKYVECRHFNAAIKKYGWSSFAHEILECNLSKQDASLRERYWIAFYQSNNPNYGYNLTTGGEHGWEHSEETRERIRKQHIGMKYSEETREKLRNIALSRDPMPLSQREKISLSNTGKPITDADWKTRSSRLLGHPVSDETRRKISEANTGKKTRSRRVICVDTGEVFDSAREASLHYGKANGSLISCLHAGCSFCGMQWKYLDDMGEYRMSISDKNIRAGIVLPKELKAKLEELAKKSNRSLNNYIVTVLQNHVNSV